MISVVLVEDEPLARQQVKELVSQHPGVQLTAECESGREAIDTIQQDRPDLVLLDIDLPDMTGFDVLEAIPESARPSVIFVTAYDRYAIKSIEVRASDYLVKPVEAARFHRAIDVVINRLEEFG